MGVCLGGIPVSTNSRVCDYFRCHIQNNRAVRIWKGSSGQEEPRGLLFFSVLFSLRKVLERNHRSPRQDTLKMDLCVLVLSAVQGDFRQGSVCGRRWKARTPPLCIMLPGKRSQPRAIVTLPERERASHSFIAVPVPVGAVFFKAQVGSEVSFVVLE